jgi:amphi-Trp domain-containing protein
MGTETRLFKSEERKNRADAGAFLHQLADKIIEGRVVLRAGQEEISLEIPHNVILEIQVEDEDKKSKGMQHSLEIEIKWFDAEGASGPLELG